MSEQGFDTWILEVRGAGLSVRGSDLKEVEQSANAVSEQMEDAAESATHNGCSTEQQMDVVSGDISTSEDDYLTEEPVSLARVGDESKLVTKLTEAFMRLSERLSGFLSDGQSSAMSAKFVDQISRLLEDSQLSDRFNEIRGKLLSLLEKRQTSVITSQIRDLSQRLVNIVEESQQSVTPQLFDLQEHLFSTIEDFQKQLDLIVKYDWDFDHYLEEDVPAAVR